MSFAAVYIPEFPLVASYRTGQRSYPLAIVEGEPPLEKVVALNSRAKTAGIEHGMSRVQAEALGSVSFYSRRVEDERAAFDAVLALIGNFSPRVETVASPANGYGGRRPLAASMLIDGSGTETLFGDAQSYAGSLQQALAAAGFPAGVAIAPNVEAALLLARVGKRPVCATAHTLEAKLAPLSIGLLPCGLKVASVLRGWGIRTLGELAALPEVALISRLGEEGRRMQQLARGQAERLLSPDEPEIALWEAATLDTPVTLLDSLLFVLSPLLEAVMRRAVERACALRTVRLILRLDRATPHTTLVRPALPTQDRGLLLKLIRLELEAHPPSAPILEVTLEAEAALPPVAQRGLFQTQFPDPGKLDLLLARLRSIAGEGNVGAPVLSNSSRLDAFTLHAYKPSLRVAAERAGLPTRSALRMCRPPRMLRVSCSDHRPSVLFWEGMRMLVAAAAGPWQSSGSWWNEQAWDDELWDVAIAEPAQVLRLRYERSTQAWFVVGLYD